MASAELQTIIDLLRQRPIAEALSIEQMRAGMEAFVSPVPEDVVLVPASANGVPAEWISAPGAATEGVILYLHGGGYVLGSIATHRELVARLSRAAGVRGFALDYRLAPEHPFPAAVDDAVAGYRWLLAQGTRAESVVIGGDSAGGGLVLATLVALKERGEPMPAAAVCLSPWVDLEGLGASMVERAALDPMVQSPGLQQMAAMYLGGAGPRAPLAAPLYADLAGLPPLLIQVGTAETLLDDATRIAERARAAGVEVTLEPWEEMIHVWQIFPQLPEARQATDRIGAFVREKLTVHAGT